MTYKLIGAALIICGCGLVGFKLSAACHTEEHDLRQLIIAMDYMVCELSYRMRALPDLCGQVGKERNGHKPHHRRIHRISTDAHSQTDRLLQKSS